MAEWFEDWFDEDYALIYAHRDAAEACAAVGMALREAPELARGPVLDLGCGAGRHLAALRHHNPAAFGLDLSRPLLGRAPEGLRPWLLQADMRKLPVREGALAGICLWFTPFGYFPDAENLALLQDLGRRLRAGGILLLDYLNAEQVLETLVHEDTLERAGIRVVSRRTLEDGRLVKRMTLLRLATGETRQAIESVRLYRPADVEQLALRAGLRLRRALGDYEGGPAVASSPRWIGVFERTV